jgi:hypothetical protein
MNIAQRHERELSGHIEELAEILVAGLMRLRAGKSSAKADKTGEISLDFSISTSGHPTSVRGNDGCLIPC